MTNVPFFCLAIECQVPPLSEYWYDLIGANFEMTALCSEITAVPVNGEITRIFGALGDFAGAFGGAGLLTTTNAVLTEAEFPCAAMA